jgi:hypothetical protein
MQLIIAYSIFGASFISLSLNQIGIARNFQRLVMCFRQISLLTSARLIFAVTLNGLSELPVLSSAKDISINGFINDLQGFIRCLLRAYLARSLLHVHWNIGFGVEWRSIMYCWYVYVQN